MAGAGEETFTNQHLGKIQHALQIMRAGEPMLKYGRRGKPHMRYFRINSDGTKIFWVQKSNEPLKGGIILAEVSRVQHGRDTPVFARFRSKSTHDQVNRSLSLITNDRTLDVETSTIEQCQLWQLGLKYCVHQAHKQEGLHASLMVPSASFRRRVGGTASSQGSKPYRRGSSEYSLSDVSSVGNFDSDNELSVTLAPSNAKVVCEGWLGKRNDDKIGVYKERYFVLRADDTLTYYSADINSQPRAHAKGVISLSSVSMIEVVTKRRQKNGVNIHTPHRIFVLNAKSKNLQEKWVDVLMDTLTEIKQHRMEATDDHSHHQKSCSASVVPAPALAHHTSPALPSQTFGADVSPLPPKRGVGVAGAAGARVSLTRPRQGSDARPVSAKFATTSRSSPNEKKVRRNSTGDVSAASSPTKGAAAVDANCRTLTSLSNHASDNENDAGHHATASPMEDPLTAPAPSSVMSDSEEKNVEAASPVRSRSDAVEKSKSTNTESNSVPMDERSVQRRAELQKYRDLVAAKRVTGKQQNGDVTLSNDFPTAEPSRTEMDTKALRNPADPSSTATAASDHVRTKKCCCVIM